MPRRFNTAGPCLFEDHYMLSRKLTAEGKYAALTISLGSFVTSKPESVMPQLLKGLWSDAEYAFPADLQPPKVDEFVGDPLITLVARLLRQHTEEAGQPFEPDAMDEVFHQTGGQPWLVNALANQLTTHYNALVKDRGIPVTRDHVLAAKEILVERRDTHLDSLVHRLREPRIKRVIEPIMVGEVVVDATYDDDFSYTKDLGLVTAADGGPRRIANPIYAEIIARALIHQVQTSIPEDPAWFVRGDGTLDIMKLIAGFLEFWRENGEVLLRGLPYQEAAPHLVFMGYLQRIVNGGRVEREFALGTRRAEVFFVALYGFQTGFVMCQVPVRAAACNALPP